MKKFYSFLLTVGLLIWCSQSHVAFGVVGPITAGAFRCLQSSVTDSIPYVIIRAYQHSNPPTGIDPNAIQTFKNAFDAGYKAAIYVEICRGVNATAQINLVDSTISPLKGYPNANLDPAFFIKIILTNNTECSWAGYSPSENCDFLKEAANAVKNTGYYSPVFYSSFRIWATIFQGTCDTFAQDTGAKLSFVKYEASGHLNTTQTFIGFVPFGGWTAPSSQVIGKHIGGNVTIPLLCGSKAWHAFIDLVWIP